MKVLVCGANGFIGAAVTTALLRRGHQIVAGVRHLPHSPDPAVSYITMDFGESSAGQWASRLKDVDAVVNAVGIFRESAQARFDALHTRAPVALFEACRAAGVKRVVQVSALGADATAATAFLRSKFAADEALLGMGLSAAVVQPSLVTGEGGASARLFAMLATPPLVPLPGDGMQRVQPVLIDDVAEAIARLCEEHAMTGRIAAVGPEPLSLRDWLADIRRALGLGPARFLPVPLPLVQLAALAGRASGRGLLDPAALVMLARPNTADPARLAQLLGRAPTPAARHFSGQAALRTQAQLAWLLPLLRASLAFVWIWSGIVSLGLYPVERSYELLRATAVPQALAPIALYSAALLDMALGVATLLMRRRRLLYLAQMLLILGYTAIISWALPEFWLHPYAPVAKNLPMLAALFLLYQLERPR